MLSFKSCVLAGTLFVLSACGFTPLYSQTKTINILADFQRIEIQQISNKIGLDLRNKLIEILQPQGKKFPLSHRLNVTLTEEKSSLAVKKSAFATRANLTIRANYQLYNIDGIKTVFSAKSRSSVSYDLLTDQYATLAAEKNARTRAVGELAEKLKIQLGAYYRRVNQ